MRRYNGRRFHFPTEQRACMLGSDQNRARCRKACMTNEGQSLSLFKEHQDGSNERSRRRNMNEGLKEVEIS